MWWDEKSVRGNDVMEERRKIECKSWEEEEFSKSMAIKDKRKCLKENCDIFRTTIKNKGRLAEMT